MIAITNLEVNLPEFSLGRIKLRVAPGEFFILLGPTGAGKTLLLEALAGIIPITAGKIAISGRDVTGLPSEKRAMAIVYQDYALFPHLSVIDNIRFGLPYTGMEPGKAKAWVNTLVKRLGLANIARRAVTNLSGGEKQRTALARALAVKPNVLLLDEPLAALDPNFRQEIRWLLKQVQRQFAMTTIMVTHDFTDALELGQRMAVMINGRLQQTGTVQEVFATPENSLVASFLSGGKQSANDCMPTANNPSGNLD